MASENETVAEIVSKVRSGDYGCAKCGDLCDCPNADKIIVSIAVRMEKAHKREIAELKTKLSNTETARKFFAIRLDGAKKEVAELRECLKEAIDVACDGCKFSVWKNKSLVKCKKHKNWKCPFGTERWHKAMEGEE